MASPVAIAAQAGKLLREQALRPRLLAVRSQVSAAATTQATRCGAPARRRLLGPQRPLARPPCCPAAWLAERRPWCSSGTRATSHGRSRGWRGRSHTHTTVWVVSHPPHPPSWHWSPALAPVEVAKVARTVGIQSFPSLSWSGFGGVRLPELARPATCSTCQKTGGSQGCSPARVNSAGCCSCSLCVLLFGGNAGVQEQSGSPLLFLLL